MVSAKEALELAIARRAARNSFLAWCMLVMKDRGKEPARHHKYLIKHLQKVSDGEIDRLIINMPPGSAKSTYTSELFPPWFMMRNPGAQIIHGSASLNLVMDFSGKIQSLCDEYQQVLGFSPKNENKELWYGTNNCRYRAAGVESKISGNRSDMTLIDDPFGSWAEAQSGSQREAVYNWFRGDILGRQLPGARIIIIQTRWHEDDLTGRLLADDPDEWTVLRLPQLAEENDPLGREPGEVLWPEFEGPDVIARRRKTVGERGWAALHQQSPRPVGGSLFDVTKLHEVMVAPRGDEVRAWDLAATADIGGRDPDYTVGARMLLADDGEAVPEGCLVISDVVRARGGPEQIEQLILETAKKDGPGVSIYLPQDPGQSGKSQVAYLTRKLHGYHVIAERPSGNKSTRAMPIASQLAVGNVYIVRGNWNRALKDELEVFPGGSHDDQVDALSSGYSALINHLTGAAVTVQKLGY